MLNLFDKILLHIFKRYLKDIQTRFTKRVCKMNLIGINKIPTFPLSHFFPTLVQKRLKMLENVKTINVEI